MNHPQIAPVDPLFSSVGDLAVKASQLTIEPITLIRALELNAAWHSKLPRLPASVVRGMGPRHVCYAATHEDGIYGVGIWSDAIAANRMRLPSKCILELRRLAIPEYSPKYTATRMLGRMARRIKIDFPEVHRLISYQMTDTHNGTIYKAANWSIGYEQKQHLTHCGHHGTSRPDQNTSPKIRWELIIKDCKCQKD